jgi:RND family efflux transporter MFP subunit
MNLAVLAMLAITLTGCGNQETPQKESSAPIVVRADSITVAKAQSPGRYEVSGTVKSELNATLSSKVMGHVVSVASHEGDSIAKGQLLVSLDARELQAAVQVAQAGYRSSQVAVETARTGTEMEEQSAKARVAQAISLVSQTKAALRAAEAHRDLVLAGPRKQEVQQTHLAVVQAESNLKLATRELERTKKLVADEALAKRDLDIAQNRYDVAKGQRDIAIQSESIAREGARSQEIQAAQEGVSQAQSAVSQAQSGLLQARAAELQVTVKRQGINVAKAQVEQANASLQSAQVGLSYAQVLAPFDGRVIQRIVDPGSMATPGSSLLMVEGGTYRLEAIVPESLIQKMQTGTQVDVRIDALNTKLTGKVVEVVPQADKATHTFLVKLVLPAAKGLKSGMYGTASIPLEAVDRLLIPKTATWERDGLNYVYGLTETNTARLRIVTLGAPIGDQVEVLSGLNPGDRIVVGDRSKVVDGAKVEGK